MYLCLRHLLLLTSGCLPATAPQPQGSLDLSSTNTHRKSGFCHGACLLSASCEDSIRALRYTSPLCQTGSSRSTKRCHSVCFVNHVNTLQLRIVPTSLEPRRTEILLFFHIAAPPVSPVHNLVVPPCIFRGEYHGMAPDDIFQ